MAKYFLQFFLLSLMLLSCSKFDEGAVDPGILFSTGYSVSVVQNQSTKVSLYSGAADLLSKDGFLKSVFFSASESGKNLLLIIVIV